MYDIKSRLAKCQRTKRAGGILKMPEPEEGLRPVLIHHPTWGTEVMDRWELRRGNEVVKSARFNSGDSGRGKQWQEVLAHLTTLQPGVHSRRDIGIALGFDPRRHPNWPVNPAITRLCSTLPEVMTTNKGEFCIVTLHIPVVWEASN